jgi:hypothetical protein
VPISFVMSVRLSVRTYQRGYHWTDFREICYWVLLRKSVDKSQIWSKSEKSMGHFTWKRTYFYTVDSYRIFCGLTTVQKEPTLACRWQRFHIVNSYMWVNNSARGTNFSVSMATVVTRTRHSFMLYVRCQSCRYCYCVPYVKISVRTRRNLVETAVS